MSGKTVCDRCGVEVHLKNRSRILDRFLHEYGRAVRIGMKDYHGEYDHYFDLCGECHDLLGDFMRGEAIPSLEADHE